MKIKELIIQPLPAVNEVKVPLEEWYMVRITVMMENRTRNVTDPRKYQLGTVPKLYYYHT